MGPAMSLIASYLERPQNEETQTAGMLGPLAPWWSLGGPVAALWQLHSILVPWWSLGGPILVPWQFYGGPTVIPCMALLHHRSTEADFPLIEANHLSNWVPPGGTKEISSVWTPGCLGANTPLLPPSTPLRQHKCGLVCTRNHFICFQISDKAATHCLFPCCWKIK